MLRLQTPLEKDTRNEEPTATPHMGLGSKGVILGRARREFSTTSENQHPQDPKNQTANSLPTQEGRQHLGAPTGVTLLLQLATTVTTVRTASVTKIMEVVATERYATTPRCLCRIREESSGTAHPFEF